MVIYYYFNKNDNITKINIILDNEIKSFERLFDECKCIEKIKFIRFIRNDINNMSYMFSGCSSLKELKLNNFNTNNVTNMFGMFSGCSSLKELNLNNFNTNNDSSCISDALRGCSDELKIKIKSQYKNIKEEALN